MMNADEELKACSQIGHRDFYNVRKIDNHIHHSAAMNAKHLLRFMRNKFKTEKVTIVSKRSQDD